MEAGYGFTPGRLMGGGGLVGGGGFVGGGGLVGGGLAWDWGFGGGGLETGLGGVGRFSLATTSSYLGGAEGVKEVLGV